MSRFSSTVFKFLVSLIFIFPMQANADIIYSSIDKLLQNDELLSTAGDPIRVISITNRNKNKENHYNFLIQGGIHGNEVESTRFVKWLSKQVSQKNSILNTLPFSITIDFVPSANPDTHGLRRENFNGIDLNRNYGVLWGINPSEPIGSTPFSEKETKAIKALMEHRNYTAAVDVHGYINWIVSPSAPKYIANATRNQKKRYKMLIKHLNKYTQALPSYSLLSAASLGDGGAFEDWAFWGNNTLAFCLEMKTKQRINKDKNGNKIDLFKKYESFIYKMFASAIKIERKHPKPEKSNYLKQITNNHPIEQKIKKRGVSISF